jgi:hypothetical protein
MTSQLRAIVAPTGDEALLFHIIFVSVNAIASGHRSRTRDDISAVRHVFLEADNDAQQYSNSLTHVAACLPRTTFSLVAEPHTRVLARYRLRQGPG